MQLDDHDDGFKSGFVTIVGRPNVGKSTLINALVGQKVTITSSRPNTTRHQIRGVRSTENAQVIFVDTPGLHKPKTPLGTRLNESALGALDDIDVVVVMIEATAEVGPGDRIVLGHAIEAVRRDGDAALFIVVNKCDKTGRDGVLHQLISVQQSVDEIVAEARLNPTTRIEYFPISAKTGKGVDTLRDALVDAMPEGPPYYPLEMTSDTAEAVFVAELVREQLLSRTRDELPHSIACRVTEWEWPRIRVEILVERDSQKAIVIGSGGEVLKAVGTAVREQLDPGCFIELFVRVEKRWQQREDQLDRLGY